MCPVTAPEKGKHRGLDLQKFPVFCSALFNIPGKIRKYAYTSTSTDNKFSRLLCNKSASTNITKKAPSSHLLSVSLAP